MSEQQPQIEDVTFALDIPPVETGGCSVMMIGSTRSGKSTALKWIMDKYFKKHCGVLFSQSIKANAYKDMNYPLICKSGAFVPGIRPGEQTSRYIDKILTRLTLAGAVYITLICLLPEFLIARWNVPFYFGGTSLLIIVVVTMDFMAQVQNYVMSQQYESLLRKANFKGGIPSR